MVFLTAYVNDCIICIELRFSYDKKHYGHWKSGNKFGVINENPVTRKLNFAEIKKNTTLCLGYTFDFYILEPNNNSAYVLQKIAKGNYLSVLAIFINSRLLTGKGNYG